jgi:GNAT superfamily N-acetyltransferase
MPLPANTAFRAALPTDALCLGVLSTQVFLDTYATSGISADLAHEAQQIHSPAAFEVVLRSPRSEITVAEVGGNLIGFVELRFEGRCPVAGLAGPEVLRLYVQGPFQGQGLGRALLSIAEGRALAIGAQSVWLTAWVGNSRALRFYPRVGFKDVGATQYVIRGNGYENRVFAKVLTASAA